MNFKLLYFRNNHRSFKFAWVYAVGMRKGELAALTWKDIDFESKTIAITKTRDEYGVRDPKTRNSIRTINMSSELAEHLASFKS